MSKALDQNDRKQMLTWAFEYQIIIHELEQEFLAGDKSALKELTDEWGQISHFQCWCVDNLSHDDGAAVLCSKFAGVGGNLLDLFLSRLDVINWREAGLAGARKVNLFEDQIGHLTYLAYAHFTNNNINKAMDLIEQAIELGRQNKNTKEYTAALTHLGMFYSQMARETEAIEVLNESLAVCEKLNDDQAKVSVLATLALCHSHLNQPHKAIDLYGQVIEIYNKTDERSAVGTTLCNMAGDLITLQRFTEAKECLFEAEEIANKLSNDTLLGLIYTQLGRWHSVQEDPKLRINVWNYYETALIFFRRKGDRIHELKVMRGLESLYHQVLNNSSEHLNYDHQSTALRKLIPLLSDQQKYQETLANCRRLLQLAKENQNLPDQLEASISLGHTALYLKQYDNAIQAHSKAMEILQKIREQDGPNINRKAEGELLLSLGQAYRHSNKPENAVECYQYTEKIAEALRKEGMKFRAMGNRGLIYADIGRYDEAISILSDALEYYEKINDHRLLGHARFNLAYAHYRKKDLSTAKALGIEALRYLTMINDPYMQEVKQQMETW